jgi:hypothetical protein
MRRVASMVAIVLSLTQIGPAGADGPPAPAPTQLAQAPGCATPPPCATPAPYQPWTTAPGTAPGTTPSIPGGLSNQSQQQANTQAPATDAFAQAPPSGGEAAMSALPNLIGDQNSFIINTSSSTHNARPGSINRGVAAALAEISRGAFKITENESPAPQDRIFVTENYFYNVNKTFNPTGVNVERTTIFREVIGFEKTFLDGDASIGMRLPFLDAQGEFIDKNDVGDLSIILKYAFVNDRQTGNLLSTGMVITVPTGPNFLPDETPDVHSTLIQPFVGGIWRSGDLFFHGFTSLLVPTNSEDVLFLFNDYGVGYTVYQSDSTFVSSISPTVEAHLNTPLNHRGSQNDPIGGLDVFDLTSGVTLGLGGRAQLTLGLATPLTGPKPFDLEAIAQLNWRF